MGEIAWPPKRVQFAQAIEGGDGAEDAEATREVIVGDRRSETGDVQSFCYELRVSLAVRLGHDGNEVR